MPNQYFNATGYPSPNAQGASSPMRDILAQIAGGFDRLPSLTGNANRMVFVNTAGTALESRSSIDGIAIGATTQAAGSFTSLLSSSLSVTGNATVAGNLGVGVAAPLDDLHVEDTLRVSRAGVSAQYLQVTNDVSGVLAYGFSAPTNAKQITIDSRTDAVDTPPSAGSNGINLRVRGVNRVTMDDTGVGITGSISLSGAVSASSSFDLVGLADFGNNLRFSGSSGTIYQAVGNALNVFSGGASSGSGGNIVVYGATHATLPNTGRLRNSTTVTLEWTPGLVDVTGALSATGSVSTQLNLVAVNRVASVWNGVVPGIGAAGDGIFARSAATGVIYFGTASDQFLSFNGTNYQFGSGGSVLLGAGTAISDGATIAGVDIGYRNLPRVNAVTRTLVAADAGKSIAATGTVTVPASVLAAGDSVLVYNNSSAAITLSQGSGLTLRQAGTANTGSLSIAARGFASIYFNSATEAIASGNVS